jgi:hypothetical protein
VNPDISPGDILAVLESDSFFSKLIRIGAWLQRKPNICDHVVIVTGQGDDGIWRGIAGSPDGVGIVECARYLSDPRTRSNHDQPKPDDNSQMATFQAVCAKALGIQYDWAAIVQDTFDALHISELSDILDRLWRWPTESDKLPGHVVCSSLAAAVYKYVGWQHPEVGNERDCAPSDWWAWSDKRKWDTK